MKFECTCLCHGYKMTDFCYESTIKIIFSHHTHTHTHPDTHNASMLRVTPARRQEKFFFLPHHQWRFSFLTSSHTLICSHIPTTPSYTSSLSSYSCFHPKTVIPGLLELSSQTVKNKLVTWWRVSIHTFVYSGKEGGEVNYWHPKLEFWIYPPMEPVI